MNLAYRPPNGDPNEIENQFKNILSKREITNKESVLVGDFDRYLENGLSKGIVHVIKHANFQLHRVHPDGVIVKT